jgi:hypothetical protein
MQHPLGITGQAGQPAAYRLVVAGVAIVVAACVADMAAAAGAAGGTPTGGAAREGAKPKLG